eukprot:CAMPEP_0198256818 /NCGR_PEP_ID=MMETSP1447-20131203/6627_1 /TAXON_ID=420782 /ORGANISM="Chaetoceros dichaeta, Strain CCMP1751" /LENGTH=262 /DNA_ID=CAMNT_0043943535 /DNA_START=86 /DNA_END=874 /DNA_ORIENTATION=-
MYLKSGLSLIILSGATSMTSSFTCRPNAANGRINVPSKRQNAYSTKPIVSSDISTNRHVCLDPFTKSRGGVTEAPRDGKAILNTIANLTASFWAAGGFVAILAKSIKRILPLAIEPFTAAAPALSRFQMLSYITMCLGFAYAEGYKGFQLKFSPMVVARSQTLKPFQGTPIHHVLFGPFYAMGLFHATKKRQIVSWSITTGVALIVAMVKKFPYPWRNIIDAGVIVGLSWGGISILGIWMRTALLGKDSRTDPCLPKGMGDR